MEQYATQMDAAKRGIVTEQIKIVAQKEKMSVEELNAFLRNYLDEHCCFGKGRNLRKQTPQMP